MIVITGAGGFIGSQLVASFNSDNITDLIVVDLANSQSEYENLSSLDFDQYCPAEQLPNFLLANSADITAIYHLGACADTTNYDRTYMFELNFEYSKRIADIAVEQEIPFVYASSAAVYGNSQNGPDRTAEEAPINVYAESKLAFDEYCRQTYQSPNSTLVGLRFFNVYGPGETQKGPMASTAYQFFRQVESGGVARLFGAVENFDAGEQLRDFVSVSDINSVCRHFGEGPSQNGVFDVGTGTARSFNELVTVLIAKMGRGEIEYIDFPESLKGKYQFFTQANLTPLRESGYNQEFTTLENGLGQYVGLLQSTND